MSYFKRGWSDQHELESSAENSSPESEIALLLVSHAVFFLTSELILKINNKL